VGVAAERRGDRDEGVEREVRHRGRGLEAVHELQAHTRALGKLELRQARGRSQAADVRREPAPGTPKSGDLLRIRRALVPPDLRRATTEPA
jgi:hypothetical protein